MKSILRITTLFIAFSYSSSVSAQSVENNPQSLVGKKFIYLGHKNEQLVTMSDAELKKHKEGCAVAVAVLGTSYYENHWQFDLEAIGTPSVEKTSGLALSKPCSGTQYNTKLVITGHGFNDREVVLDSVLKSVLLTPEAYLSRHGKTIEFRETDETESATAVQASGSIRATLVLAIEPFYTEEARKAHVQGNCVVSFVVGTNGRMQSPEITTSLESGMDAQVIRVLSLWRFDPPRVDGETVPVHTKVQIRFKLH